MKKVILIALLICFFKLQAQVKVKTEDGKIIELKSDGSWTVVGQSFGSVSLSNSKISSSGNPNTSSSDQSNTNTTSSNIKKNVLDCNEMSFGKITFNNQLNSPVTVRVYNTVTISLNHEYGVEGSKYSQYTYLYTPPYDQLLEIRPKSSSTIYNIRSGVYNYGVYEEIVFTSNGPGQVSQNTTSSESYRSVGNLQISNCSEENFDIKK